MQNYGINPQAEAYIKQLMQRYYAEQQKRQQQQSNPIMGLAQKGANYGGKYAGKQAYNYLSSQLFPTAEFTGAGSLNYGLPTAGGEFMGAGGAVPEGYGVLASTGGAGAPATGIMANAGAMGALPLTAIAGGIGLGAKGLKDLFSGKETKGWEGWGGRATLGIATGGLSEVARLAGLGRKSTKDYQKERWGNATKGDSNTGWLDFYNKSKQGTMPQVGEPIRKDAQGNWIKADGSWDPREYAGVLGNAETFGNDWFKLNEEQRNNLVSQFKNEGLYKSNKGDILITDKNRARELFNSVMSNPTGQMLVSALGGNSNWNSVKK